MEWAAVRSVAELEAELGSAYRALKDLLADVCPQLLTVKLSMYQLAKIASGASLEDACLDGPQRLALNMIMSDGLVSNVDIEKLSNSIISMWEERAKLTAFVSERLARLTPNMCALVGPEIAARLLAQVGSLKELVACPANNLQVIGREKSASFGFIADCDLISVVPKEQMAEYRKNAIRLIAAKLAIAIRADYLQSSMDGSLGQSLREQIRGKLEKLTEPLPYKIDKPLPPPIVQSRKRRGGKRARKLKEQTAMTAVRRQQNRLAFGAAPEEELVVGDKIVGKGMLDPNSRITAVDSKLRERVKKHSERALTGIYAPRGDIKNPFAFDAETALLLKK